MREKGFILIITLIILSIALLFVVAELDDNVIATELIHYQQSRNELFESAEAALIQGESRLHQENQLPDVSNMLLSDQQLLNNTLTDNNDYHCDMSKNSHEKQCYFVEAVAKRHCFSVAGNQTVLLLYYRVTARASNDLLSDHMVTLQSTDVLLHPPLSQCKEIDYKRKTDQLIYAGRQSWREIFP